MDHMIGGGPLESRARQEVRSTKVYSDMLWHHYVQSLVNHLAEVQGLVSELGPATVEDNLKDRTHESAGRLQGT